MKLGRNEPCHCGSGRKYKRCHLDSDRDQVRVKAKFGEAMVVEPVRSWIATQPGRIGDFDRQVRAPERELKASFSAEIGEGLEGAAAAAALEAYLERIEAAFAAIAGRRSRVYWLHLARRLPPLPVEGDWPVWSATLAQRVLTLGLLKHGIEASQEGEFSAREGPFGPTRASAALTDPDLIDLHRLDHLAVTYAGAAASYRRVGKGARLVVDAEGYAADADPEVEGLLQSVDQRVSSFGGLTAGSGSLVGFDPRQAEDPTPLTVLVPSANMSQADAEPMEKLLGTTLPGPTNYVPGFLELSEYRDYLSKFEAEVVTASGVTPDELLALIWAISANLMRSVEDGPLAFLQVMNTGYELITENGLEGALRSYAPYVATWLREIRGEKVDSGEAVEITRRALAAWTYQAEDLEAISMWDRLPFKLAIPDQGATLIDLSSVPEALSGLARAVGFLAGEAGNVKALDFEDKVEARVTEAGFAAWQKRKKLTAADGARRELDLGLVAGETLYVVECKAFAQNRRIDRGDFAALTGRRKSLETYLTQAKTLMEFLRENRKGRNYEVPSAVRNFEYLLCTPGVEYIWSRDPSLWITEETPRICTAAELIALLSTASLREVRTRL